MIPKRIYTIWLSPEMPDIVKECVESRKLPGYEHVLITNENYLRGNRYVDECISARKWVKASDYLRMHYLLEGGIYLDADTKVIKPFDDVLDNDMFACEEDNGFVANGIVGAIPNHPLILDYLDIVDRNFIGSGDLVFQAGMYLWTELTKERKYGKSVKLYPMEWFLPFNHQTGRTNITENTHTIHYYLRSWVK